MTKRKQKKCATNEASASLAGTAGSPIRAVRFNINEYVRVKLTPRGRAIHQALHDELNRRFPGAQLIYRPPTEDSEGWSKWQAWDLMQTFGPHISMGFDPPFETTIEVLANVEFSCKGHSRCDDQLCARFLP